MKLITIVKGNSLFGQPLTLEIHTHTGLPIRAQERGAFGLWQGEHQPLPALHLPPCEGQEPILVTAREQLTKGWSLPRNRTPQNRGVFLLWSHVKSTNNLGYPEKEGHTPPAHCQKAREGTCSERVCWVEIQEWLWVGFAQHPNTPGVHRDVKMRNRSYISLGRPTPAHCMRLNLNAQPAKQHDHMYVI